MQLKFLTLALAMLAGAFAEEAAGAATDAGTTAADPPRGYRNPPPPPPGYGYSPPPGYGYPPPNYQGYCRRHRESCRSVQECCAGLTCEHLDRGDNECRRR